MKIYLPGIQPAPSQKYIKLNSNENPYPPSPRVKEVLQKLNYEELRIYPDPDSLEIRKKLSRLYGYAEDQIICGNGSDDLLNIIIRTFASPGEAIGFYVPTFPLYKVLGTIHGVQNEAIQVAEPYDQPPDPPAQVRVFFLANPNSPIGFAYAIPLIRSLVEKVQGVFVVDEAYAEFATANALELVREFANVLVVRTVSKSYSLAGVRLGYAIGSRELIQEMFKVKDPFNVTRLTQAVVSAALDDQEYFRKNIAQIVATRDWFTKEAKGLGYRIISSQGNFIFPQPPQKGKGNRFFQSLFDRKILTRHYDEEGLRDGVRMSIGSPKDMEITLQVMKDVLKVL
ncbi:MAG: histidinol-phosphate transaminase [Proteobacteria bacterium]|nr:histidinol-phosphate transaminase [Pseudomonadota bacterium]